MNTTGNFSLSSFYSKECFYRRIAAYFCIYLFIMFTLSALSYSLFSKIPQMPPFIISKIGGGSTADKLRDITVCFTPAAVLMAVIFASVFTAANKVLSALISAWIGTSLGCTAALISDGLLYGISYPVRIYAVFLTLQAALTALLASVTAVYSSAVLYTCSCDDHRGFELLCRDYLKIFLFISGLIDLVVYITVILI